jgi:AraC-like DNA-binding protein
MGSGMASEFLGTGNVESGNIEVLFPGDRIIFNRKCHAHFHAYWEIKTFVQDGKQCVSIAAPEAVHSETPALCFSHGWVLSLQQPYVSLKINAERDYPLSFDSISENCPGGLNELVRMLANSARKGDCRHFNALLQVLCSAVSIVFAQAASQENLSPTERARKYIERYCHRSGLSVEEVANYVGVTAGHLANLFKAERLGTVRQFIIKNRLENARRLLLVRRYSVKEVAEMTGWNCQFYFSNTFRRVYGCPPSELTDTPETGYVN